MWGVRPTTIWMRGSIVRATVGGVLALLPALVRVPVATAVVGPRGSTTTTIAPGLTFTQITTSDPQQINVLTVDLRKAITLDLATAGTTFGNYSKPSTMASNRGALAAINGDFSVGGRPLHPFAEDGFLRSSGLQGGGTFAVSKDELIKSIGNVNLTMNATNMTSTIKHTLAGWNTDAPGPAEVTGYTAAGGTLEPPPANACSARLLSSGKMRWEPLQAGLYKEYTVAAQKCQPAAMRLGGGILLSSKLTGAGSEWVKTLTPGTAVRVSWSNGFAGSMDSLGGMPVLVQDGTVVAKNDCGTYFCERNPRTAIGITAEGKVLLVTVDGRCTCSLGMTLVGLANEMKSLGAVYALNLDGGGGSTMWVKGSGVVNRPSDSTGERPSTNAILILPGTDSGEPMPLTVLSGPVGPVDAAAAAALQASDPASTGGLLEAIYAGSFGPQPPLQPSWAKIARAFRRA